MGRGGAGRAAAERQRRRADRAARARRREAPRLPLQGKRARACRQRAGLGAGPSAHARAPLRARRLSPQPLRPASRARRTPLPLPRLSHARQRRRSPTAWACGAPSPPRPRREARTRTTHGYSCGSTRWQSRGAVAVARVWARRRVACVSTWSTCCTRRARSTQRCGRACGGRAVALPARRCCAFRAPLALTHIHNRAAPLPQGSVEAERYKRQGDFCHASLASHARAWTTLDAPRALAV